MRGPPPAGARLGLYRHGDTVSEHTALELCALPAFPASWLIVPSPAGDALTLAWGDACTLEKLERANRWDAAQMARFQADWFPASQAQELLCLTSFLNLTHAGSRVLRLRPKKSYKL